MNTVRVLEPCCYIFNLWPSVLQVYIRKRICDMGLLAYISKYIHIHIYTQIHTYTYICLCMNKKIRIHSEHQHTITKESCHDHGISKYSVLFMYFIDLIFLSHQLILSAFNRYMNGLFQCPCLRSLGWEKQDDGVPWNVL